MKRKTNSKLYLFSTIAVILFLAIISILNLDIFFRFYNAYQNRTLTMEKIRLDIAAFDWGRQSSVIPVDIKTSETDGMTQMYIPEGEFFMGKGEVRKNDNSPQHIVYLDAFWMDKYEVSNAMYLKCMQDGACSEMVSDNTTYNNWIYRNHPITYVTWEQANVYCQWAGRRLPTEAEWEKAARGTDGRKYPWGNEAPNARLANFDGSMIHEAVSVYRYPLGASPYGVLNMSGNVREWIADWYGEDYYLTTPYTNPTGPETGTERSLRSGSYNEDKNEITITSRYRHEPQSAGLSRGFRCAESDN